MKKVLLSLAVAAFLVSCGGAEAPAETTALDALNAIGETVKEAGDSLKNVATEVKAEVEAEVEAEVKKLDSTEAAPAVLDTVTAETAE